MDSQQNTKDMIIKLKLPDENLQKLLEITENASISLPDLFEFFLQDLIEETTQSSSILEDWLYERTGAGSKDDEDLYETVTFTNNQMEMMSLVDLINS